MIFIGKGALLKRAVQFAAEAGFCVDAVFTNGPELEPICRRHGITLEAVRDVNEEWQRIIAKCSDGLAFSINNQEIFRGAALEGKVIRLLNVHNGLIPTYRGRPEVCLVHALLNGEVEYGVTLHEIDAGIDTGRSLDVLRFPIAPEDDFESSMICSVEACDSIFRKNLERAVAGTLMAMPRSELPSRLYRLKDLEGLWLNADSPNFRRATRFGVFKHWFPESWRLIEEQLGRVSSRGGKC